MTITEKIRSAETTDPVGLVRDELLAVSVEDVARFILTTLSEDEMIKENTQDLWQRDPRHYLWTIEHILPQGANPPPAWLEMLGGPDAAAAAQSEHVHRLGNLTITGYNSNLGNKSFDEKMNRVDSKVRRIGYKNGLSLDADLVTKNDWTTEEIEDRTQRLAERVIERFSLA